MRFEETIAVPVSQDEAWAFLWQFERLAACLPGCKSVTEIESDRKYAARFEDAVGKYKFGFDMDIEVEERHPKDFVRLLCTGEDKRLRASQRVAMSVHLEPTGPTSTSMKAVADVTVLGILATLGQFVIKRKAKDIVGKFARNIAAELSAEKEGVHA